jgi:hypothetical protein
MRADNWSVGGRIGVQDVGRNIVHRIFVSHNDFSCIQNGTLYIA